jgi:peptidoglycan-N-acetylglucosamine deacetylase
MRTARRRVALALTGLVLLAVLVTGLLQINYTLGHRGYGDLAPVCRVVTSHHEVALTFDDGPDPAYTPLVLSYLHRFHDRGTFFLVGQQADRFPPLVQDEIALHMELGDHTWSHPHLPARDTTQVASQITRTQVVLERDGDAPRLFRAPYGEITPTELVVVRSYGLLPVHWSLAFDHYVGGMGLTPAAAAARVAADSSPGDIVLIHDAHILARDGGGGRPAAMAALPLYLAALHARGLRGVSVSSLLATGRAVLARPKPWFWQTGLSCP